MTASAVYLGWNGSDASEHVLALLRKRFEVVFSRHCGWGDDIDQDALAELRADYLFSFGPTIVRKPLLDSIRTAAINFHTGPPRWPGRGSVSFALYHGDESFGVTAHLMVEEVDRGPILQVLRFPIRPDDTVATLDERTKQAIPELVSATLDGLDAAGVTPTGEEWERAAATLAEMRELMRIEENDDDEAVRRKVRAFAHPEKPGPYLERAGSTFWHLGNGGGGRQ